MFHRIEKVDVLSNKILKIKFKNKKIKYYDMKKVIKKIEEFNILENETIFQTAKIDVGGYAVIWNDNLDIDCEELYKNGVDKI